MAAHRKDTVIVSTRLVIEPARKKDFEDWSGLRKRSRKHLQPWEPTWPKDANSRADWARRLQAWKNGWKSGRAYVFMIRRLKDGKLVGGISLTNVRGWPANSASLGYWLGQDHQGQGLMQEGVGAEGANGELAVRDEARRRRRQRIAPFVRARQRARRDELGGGARA